MCNSIPCENEYSLDDIEPIVSLEPDSTWVSYANELVFAKLNYTPKELKLFDLIASQLSLGPLYDEGWISQKEGEPSPKVDKRITNSTIQKIYNEQDLRTIVLSKALICDYVGISGKFNRLGSLKVFRKKSVTLRKKLFTGDSDESQIGSENYEEVTMRPFLKAEQLSELPFCMFIVNPEFVPYILGIQAFKRHRLEVTSQLKRNLSLRLYKLIHYYHNGGGATGAKHTRVFKVQEFLNLLAPLPKSYTADLNLLIGKGLNPALNEIKEQTGLSYRLVRHKQNYGGKGRPSISGFQLLPE